MKSISRMFLIWLASTTLVLASQTYEPGKLIVYYHDDYVPISISIRNDIVETGLESIDSLNVEFECYDMKRLPGNDTTILRGYYLMYFPISANLDTLVTRYTADSTVGRAFKNGELETYEIPNDPFFSSYDTVYQANLSPYRLMAAAAWDTTRGDSNVVVQVIDIDFMWYHPDLQGQFWVNSPEDRNGNGVLDTLPYGEGGDFDGVDNDGNGYIDDVIGYNFTGWDTLGQTGGSPDPMIYEYRSFLHGTPIAGIIAAAWGNSEGVTGIAPDCRIMATTIYGTPPRWDELLAAIKYGIKNNTDIISLSLGPNEQYTTEEEALVLAPALVEAYDSGIVIVAAMGNTYGEIKTWPAAWDGWICDHILFGETGCEEFDCIGVSSVDTFDVVGSTYGSWCDVCAPHLTVFTDGYWEADSGRFLPSYDQTPDYSPSTSWATPQVAAMAALIKSHFPSFTRDQTINQVCKSVDGIAQFNPDSLSGKLGTGRINLFKGFWNTDTSDCGQCVRFGEVTNSGSWNSTFLIGDITIADSVTVSIDDPVNVICTDVLFDGQDEAKTEIIVKGKLVADPTAVFRSVSDDPGESDWYGISVIESGQVVLEGDTIRNAYIAIDLNSDECDTVNSCVLLDNEMYGIYCRNDSSASVETWIHGNYIEKDSAATYTGYGIRTDESPLVDSNTVRFYGYGIFAVTDEPQIKSNTIHCASMGVHARSTDSAVIWSNKFTGHFSRAIDCWHADANIQANIICPDTLNDQDGCTWGLNFGPYGDGVVWFNRFFNCADYGAKVTAAYPNFGDGEDVGGNWFRIPDTSAAALYSSVGIDAERCLWQLGDSVLTDSASIDDWVDGSVDFVPFAVWLPPDPEPYVPTPPDHKAAVPAERNSEVPRDYALDQNYPNPFNPITVISYALPDAAAVRLDVYNVLGQHVVTLVDLSQPAGYYRVVWNGEDRDGRSCPSGVYLYKLKAGDFSRTRKMLLLK